MPTHVLHERHYTVDQANAARAWVDERLERIQAALASLRTPGVGDALEDLDVATGGAYPGREAAQGALALLLAASELEAMDIVLRDADRGLVDFPSMRDGREVYLCWQQGEDEVAYWHEAAAGFAGRSPL